MSNKKSTVTVKLTKGDVFEIDPDKKYLVLLKSGSISQDAVLKISNRIRREFGDAFVLAVPRDTEMEAIATDRPREAAAAYAWHKYQPKHGAIVDGAYDIRTVDGAYIPSVLVKDGTIHVPDGRVYEMADLAFYRTAQDIPTKQDEISQEQP